MLAHRVGQYYGLQTSTVDYEESQGRVLGIRTAHCHVPKDDDRVAQSSSEHSLNQSPARTLKERQENYSKYREELGLGEGLGPGRGPGRGSYGGRGGYGSGPRGGGMEGGMGMGMGRGGGRKAVFRDKDRDLSDPDYRRGMGSHGNVAPGAGVGGGMGKGSHQQYGGGGSMGGRSQQQQQQQMQQQQQQQLIAGQANMQQAQQQQQFSHAIAAAPYGTMSGQYGVPMTVTPAGFMSAASPHAGQPVFGMTTSGGALPAGTTVYAAAPAPGVGGTAFYPAAGMSPMGAMGMGTVSMAVPAGGAYGYMTAAPGPGMGAMQVATSGGEAIALTPQGAVGVQYPVYAYNPAGTAVYPAAGVTTTQIQGAAGAAQIPMRPVYGVPTFYQQYDPSQYTAIQQQQQQTGGMQSMGQGMHGMGSAGDGRGYGGGYGSGGGVHHQHQQQQQQHHAGSGGGYGSHHHGGSGMGHGGGGRHRDSDNGGGQDLK
eukprot:XP_001700206.1 predicted protein [Chlamydomonas reinhardtii]